MSLAIITQSAEVEVRGPAFSVITPRRLIEVELVGREGVLSIPPSGGEIEIAAAPQSVEVLQAPAMVEVSRSVQVNGTVFQAADLAAEDASYLYYGKAAGWSIERVARPAGNAAPEIATAALNPAYPDFASAWAARAALTYGAA